MWRRLVFYFAARRQLRKMPLILALEPHLFLQRTDGFVGMCWCGQWKTASIHQAQRKANAR